jgi:7-cyano-7-deazaguanine synthase in queuosine biosynthesis
MQFFNQAQSMLMPILEKNKNIGVMFSGGLDSGTLTWVLCKIIQDNALSNVVTLYTSPRPDNSLAHADKLKNIIQESLDVKLQHKIRGDGTAHHSKQVSSGIVQARTENDIVLTAETAMPEHMQTDHFERIRVDDPKVAQPFFNLTKDFTVGLAIELGLTDIMTYSHSCTETLNIRCGECWWCRERAWAFEQNNYADPGKY